MGTIILRVLSIPKLIPRLDIPWHKSTNRDFLENESADFAEFLICSCTCALRADFGIKYRGHRPFHGARGRRIFCSRMWSFWMMATFWRVINAPFLHGNMSLWSFLFDSEGQVSALKSGVISAYPFWETGESRPWCESFRHNKDPYRRPVTA